MKYPIGWIGPDVGADSGEAQPTDGAPARKVKAPACLRNPKANPASQRRRTKEK
jgi:hypothetical protein